MYTGFPVWEVLRDAHVLHATTHMFVALIASLFFTLTYATLAAKSRSFALTD